MRTLAILCAALVLSAARAEDSRCGKNHYILDYPCDLSATDVAIGRARALAVDDFGNVYISGPSIVFKMDSAGFLTRVAGNGTDGYSGDGGPATEAQLNFPEVYPELAHDFLDFWEFLGGVAVDREGNLFIADAYNDRIRKVDTQGIISTVIGVGMTPAPSDVGLPVYNAWWWPQGIAVDGEGSLYVSGGYGNLIKIPREGPIKPLAVFGWEPSEGIALDSDGNVYVANALWTIWKVQRDGKIVAAASAGDSYWYGGETVLMAPYSVALDPAGSLLIADTWNNCIRKIDGAGIMKTIAGQCGWKGAGYFGDGGAAKDARFKLPFGVAVDKAGNVYVADSGNNRVRKIDADGLITTVAGNGQPLSRP